MAKKIDGYIKLTIPAGPQTRLRRLGLHWASAV